MSRVTVIRAITSTGGGKVEEEKGGGCYIHNSNAADSGAMKVSLTLPTLTEQALKEAIHLEWADSTDLYNVEGEKTYRIYVFDKQQCVGTTLSDRKGVREVRRYHVKKEVELLDEFAGKPLLRAREDDSYVFALIPNKLIIEVAIVDSVLNKKSNVLTSTNKLVCVLEEHYKSGNLTPDELPVGYVRFPPLINIKEGMKRIGNACLTDILGSSEAKVRMEDSAARVVPFEVVQRSFINALGRVCAPESGLLPETFYLASDVFKPPNKASGGTGAAARAAVEAGGHFFQGAWYPEQQQQQQQQEYGGGGGGYGVGAPTGYGDHGNHPHPPQNNGANYYGRQEYGGGGYGGGGGGCDGRERKRERRGECHQNSGGSSYEYPPLNNNNGSAAQQREQPQYTHLQQRSGRTAHRSTKIPPAAGGAVDLH